MLNHKTASLLTFIAATLFVVLPVLAEQDSRVATVEDTAGASTEVTELTSAVNTSRYVLDYDSRNCVVVETGTFEIALPFQYVVNVVQSKDAATVTYRWRGKETTIQGKLKSQYMRGKSDFGDFQMKTDKIRKLAFRGPPAAGRPKRPTEPIVYATLELTDGSEVPVAALQRYVVYYTTAGYLIGGCHTNYSGADLPFMRGESTATVEMKQLSHVEFGPDDTLTVTLTNGKAAAGKLASGRDGIDGFCGVRDNGHFFIERKHIKAIRFGKKAE